MVVQVVQAELEAWAALAVLAVLVVPAVVANGRTIRRTAAEHHTVIVERPTGLVAPDAVPSRIARRRLVTSYLVKEGLRARVQIGPAADWPAAAMHPAFRIERLASGTVAEVVSEAAPVWEAEAAPDWETEAVASAAAIAQAGLAAVIAPVDLGADRAVTGAVAEPA